MNNISKKSIKEWVIIRTIFSLVLIGVSILVISILNSKLNPFLAKSGLSNILKITIKVCIYFYFVLINVWSLIYALVFPKMQYERWHYSIHDNMIETTNGVIFTSKKYVPFIRLQHVEISRGILDRIFKISSVFIFTAGGAIRIPNLECDIAEDIVSHLKVLIADLAVEEQAND